MRRILFGAGLLVMAVAAVAQPHAPTEKPMVTAARLNAQLAVAYLKENEIAAAQEKIDKALTQNPSDPGVQVSAGLVYERLEQPDKADHFFAEAVRLDPKNPDLLNNYAVFLCRRGRYDKGQKLFEQAASNPAYSTPEVAYANAGVCARSAKNLPRAEELFRKSLAARDNYPDALLQLADLTFGRGAGLAARGLLARYFAVAPASPEALMLAIKVERSLGDHPTADRYRQQLMESFPDSPQARQLRGAVSAE
ncbi:MAG TPA: type IV pilus biogenesis/stability protein PilW [Steroidobacteraceae bacterium]|nr:type IV pilus biogenesis/stability protein PilW [Steroidobacteraceae bacterium]